MTGPRTRRALLRGSALALPLLAGCSLPSGDDGTTTPERYPLLEQTTLYLDPRVRLDLPSAVEHAGDAADADIALLPVDPDIDPERAVEWLLDGTAVGVLGRPAHEFLLRVQTSDAADEALGQGGYGVPSPPPHFQIGHVVRNDDGSGIVATAGFSWGDLGEDELPNDDRVLGALEQFLTDRASETPTR
ncbi:hypothetical protein [Halomarina rubra]|uniref:Uncharacterized protein n=1 Tax=Halomarina rubra TaxID=2071873 RepID=A0ABD6AZY5_9EURY|nr:hypothetical protein [Halomarina rubra]